MESGGKNNYRTPQPTTFQVRTDCPRGYAPQSRTAAAPRKCHGTMVRTISPCLLQIVGAEVVDVSMRDGPPTKRQLTLIQVGSCEIGSRSVTNDKVSIASPCMCICILTHVKLVSSTERASAMSPLWHEPAGRIRARRLDDISS